MLVLLSAHLLAAALGADAGLASAASSAAEARQKKNVLYLVFDDLRPDMPFYGKDFMSTPHLSKLAATGTVFTRAYANIAVCSPSRMSFTTGRRPNTTKTWNFLNHFRQATFESCQTTNRKTWVGTPLMDEGWNISNPEFSGGAGQCCTDCTARKEKCAGWTYTNTTCTLFASVQGQVDCSYDVDQLHPCVSGVAGAQGEMPRWTTLPGSFKSSGYNVLGVGKYFHDGCAGLGAKGPEFPAGNGMPPMGDPPSWTDVDVQFPKSLKPLFQEHGEFPNSYGQDGGVYVDAQDEFCQTDAGNSLMCPLKVPADGNVSGTDFKNPFCDYVTYNHAITQLRWAAEQRRQKGTPFFQVVGFRRPHLNWRFPEPYAELYPKANVALPLQPVLDRSINDIEWVSFGPLGGHDPRNRTNTEEMVRTYRQHYYAAASWADYAVGRVLEELEQLGLHNSTMVIMHSDHGWHLGEYNMWEKRSLFENAVRVPLVIRVPWLQQSVGARSDGIVELVDMYRTVHDVMGVPLPTGDSYPIEGNSVKPLLEDPAKGRVKDVALSVYPRCPYSGGAHEYDSVCIHKIERTEFTYMGYSIRTEQYRYTEYVAWDGAKLQPDFSKVHSVSLYNHSLDDGGAEAFDGFENVNVADKVPNALLTKLSAKLRESFAQDSSSTGGGETGSIFL